MKIVKESTESREKSLYIAWMCFRNEYPCVLDRLNLPFEYLQYCNVKQKYRV